jgi:FkbM family methyltransferase
MEKYIEKLLDIIDYNGGFYIECGANDGITQSYTYELEKRNWKGILIEPSTTAYYKCISNRSKKNLFYNCALVSDNKTEIVGDFDGSCMASVNGERLGRSNMFTVKCRTLTLILDELKTEINGLVDSVELLNKINNIDLFSLDVEGYELEVLKGLDFSKYSPKYLLIEIYSKDYDEIFNYLQNNKYEFVLSTTNFNKIDNPHWDGTHNDYLFKKI